jgi:hypothetical protein
VKFLEIIDAIGGHKNEEGQGKYEHDESDLTVMGGSQKQQQTEDQHQCGQGIGSPNDLTDHGIGSLKHVYEFHPPHPTTEIHSPLEVLSNRRKERNT